MKRRLIHYNYANEVRVPKRVKKVDQRFGVAGSGADQVDWRRANAAPSAWPRPEWPVTALADGSRGWPPGGRGGKP
jgi:hypothetical protein